MRFVCHKATSQYIVVVAGRDICLLHNQLWVCDWEGPHMHSVHTHTRVELVAAPGSLFLTRKLC